MVSTCDHDFRDLPEGISSLLDTDLYKLTIQCAVLKYFHDVGVSYTFTNRTPQMKLTRAAFRWLEAQVQKLGNVSVTQDELRYLESTCPYLDQSYLMFLSNFRLRPLEQVDLSFIPIDNEDGDDATGELHIEIKGLWVDTILYEVPLLALTSEAYFRFCDRDWNYNEQSNKARRKATTLLQHGCLFSEFGSRRRRDYHTQDLVIQGLCQAAEEGGKAGWSGRLIGTSNVHFAMKHGLMPVGTVAHEWFMGVAAITDNYESGNELALRYWVGCFGYGVLGIALTDTFGTETFLKAFRLPAPIFTSAAMGMSATSVSAAAPSNMVVTGSLGTTEPPIHALPEKRRPESSNVRKSYAEVFTGVRQDSGDAMLFIKTMREFYDREGIKEKKVIVFSDSLNIERCLEYKAAAEQAGFQPSFGIGTFLTNDYVHASSGTKSAPLNIVIKLSSAAGRMAVKISDNIGKNTGDRETVMSVKRRLGYVERHWDGGDETSRWGADEGSGAKSTSVTA